MRSIPKQRQKRAISALRTAYNGISLKADAAGRIRDGFWAEVSKSERPNSRRPFLLKTVLVSAALSWLVLMVFLLGERGQQAPASEKRYAVVVSAIEGFADVRDRDMNDLVQVSVNATFSEGAVLSTARDSGKGGRAELALGPHRMQVAPGTEVSFNRLEKQALDFELRQGKIGLSVAKLPLGGRLQVISGETTVRVVGTAFSVEREDDCVTVAVTEGIVEVRNDSVMDMLNAGEERTLCDSLDETLPQPTAAPMPTETPPSPAISDSATDEAPPRHRQKATPPHFTERSGDTASPTPEEALFMEAQSVLNRGDAADADEVFEQYLQVYPSGVFSEDALFHLTKTAYRRGAYDEVCARGERFLDRYDRASLPRQAQVRILCAKVQISKQHAPTKAWETISPLENEVDELSPQLQKQMISLLLKSACGANRPEACRRWAREYHDRYPNGALAEMAGDEVID